MLFLLRLIQDIIFDSYLGQHALALVVVGYIASLSYQRIRTYGPWQQAGWVFVLVGITQMLFHWLRGLAGASVPGLHFLLPAFTSALAWPLIYVLLERWRLRLRVS